MRRFPILPGLLGWAIASFFTSLFVGLALSAFQIGGAWGPVGMATALAAIFFSFGLGGYAAGRLGGGPSLPQGLLVFGWTIAFTALGTAGGQILGAPEIGVMLSPFAVNWAAVTTKAILGLVVVALVMVAGGIAGGRVAEGKHPRRQGALRQG